MNGMAWKKAAAYFQSKKSKETSRRILAAVYDWTEAAVFSLVCVVLIFTFLIRIVGVDGTSMESTLMHQDRLLLYSWGYEPQRGDIVVINRFAEEPLIKRVIAIPGDTIDIDEEGTVWLNGAVLEEPYLDPDNLRNGTGTPRNQFSGPRDVPDGYLFVMGDNRLDSKDSRSTEVDLVRIGDVVGKAVFRVWPLSRFGSIY